MGTSGQRRRGIPHARDGDEFEPRGWTDRRTKIGSGMVGGPSEVRPLSSSNAVREREREKSGISSRTPDLFELFYLSFFHFSTSSSSPVFLQLPLFSFLLHRVSRSPFSLSLPSSYTSIDHDILIFLFVAPSPPSPRSEKDSTVHGTSPRLAADTHNPPRKLRIRAQHTRERERSLPPQLLSIDRWRRDHRSNLGSNISFLPSRRSLRRIFLHGRSTIPRRDSGVREPSSSFSSSSSLRRGCLEGGVVLLLLPSSCDPAGRYLGTTGHPGGPLTRHDRPWDTGRNAPRSKRRASERSSIFSTRPPRCFRVIRRETTTGFWTLGGLRLAESKWYDFYLLFVFFFLRKF